MKNRCRKFQRISNLTSASYCLFTDYRIDNDGYYLADYTQGDAYISDYDGDSFSPGVMDMTEGRMKICSARLSG